MDSQLVPKEVIYSLGEPISAFARTQGKGLSIPNETERRLNEAQEIARIGSWELDVRTQQVSWSPETFRLFECDPHDPIPNVETIHSRLHPDDRVALESLLNRAAEFGTPYEFNMRFFRADGSTRWLFTRGRGIVDKDGNVARLVGVIQDVTEQKEVEQMHQYIMRSARCLLWTSEIRYVSDSELEWDTVLVSESAAESFLPLERKQGESYLDAMFRSREQENTDMEYVHTHTRECILDNEGYSHTYKVRSKYGKMIWLCEDVKIEVISPGRWRAIGVTTDITEQKEAELLQQHVMRSARCIFWVSEVRELGYCLEWRTQIFSDSAAESFLAVARQVGESYNQALVRLRDELNENIAAVHAQSGASVRAGKGYNHNYKIRNKAGQLVWLHEDVNVEIIGPGKWRATGITTDITERMVAQDRLKQSAEARRREHYFLRSIIDASSDVIFVMDADGVFTLVNKALCDFHGLSENEMLGKKFSDFVVDPESAALINEYKAKALASPQETFHYDQRLDFGDKIYWSQAMHRAIPSLDGERYEVLVISINVTERMIAQERLQQANAQMHEAMREAEMARDVANDANRAKSEFLANMSHEIRTPMNGVLGMTQLLGYTSMNAEQQDYVATLQQSAEALLVVIDDILNISKLEAGKFELHPVNYDLPELIDEVMALMEPCAHRTGLRMAKFVANDVPIPVHGDSVRVRQVMLNLIGNAIKFTATGTISLSCHCVESMDAATRLRIAVTDTGPGISRADQARLFQSFSQVDSSATRRFGGTGLGLAISKQLVELMGGTIGVESEPGTGSTFWFELPITLCGAE